MELDGNTFIIVNKKYDHAKLAMWGTNTTNGPCGRWPCGVPCGVTSRDMGTHEQKIYPDQFWQLKQNSNHPGYYYIYNVMYDGYRVAKWGKGDEEVGSYNGQYHSDQLWKFVIVEGNYCCEAAFVYF